MPLFWRDVQDGKSQQMLAESPEGPQNASCCLIKAFSQASTALAVRFSKFAIPLNTPGILPPTLPLPVRGQCYSDEYPKCQIFIALSLILGKAVIRGTAGLKSALLH